MLCQYWNKISQEITPSSDEYRLGDMFHTLRYTTLMKGINDSWWDSPNPPFNYGRP